jgi:hypothetical protein
MTDTALIARLRADERMNRLLPRLVEVRAAKARLDAEEARLLAEAQAIGADWTDDADEGRSGSVRVGSDAGFPYRSIAAEIGAAWRVSDRTVQRQMSDAATLVGDYAGTLEALDAGAISAAHVRAIVTAGAILESPEMRSEFERDVLPIACTESATRLTPLAKRRAEWYADTTFEQRHRRAVEDRAVWVTDVDDGMAELRALLPAVVAHGIHDRLSEMTRSVIDARRTNTDTDADADAEDTDTADVRTTDQIRADILGDLLLTATPTAHDGGSTDLGAIRATVQITVPVMSLIEKRITDPYETAFLVGHSPVDPETACMLTAGATGWDRILTHPISGQVLAVDRYRPSQDQRRHLTVRDQHCRFPGCRMPAKRCDVDHTIDHAHGGVTCEYNLALLCERHHLLKHNTAWTVTQLPAGVLEWTSPTGRVYIDKPISTIEFAPDPEHEIPDDPIPATAMRLPEELEPDDFEFDELEFDPLALIPF